VAHDLLLITCCFLVRLAIDAGLNYRRRRRLRDRRDRATAAAAVAAQRALDRK